MLSRDDAGAGSLHAIALTASGDVYGWGYRPRSGVVGAGDFVLQPTYVMSDVTAIAIGIDHNLALTTESTL
ncbi:MAG TPA: hypothetical protein PLL18_12685, partial [Flavobacteriales bacterium]|nr:hypothetical protein [Flavobacteriales bacterium]